MIFPKKNHCLGEESTYLTFIVADDAFGLSEIVMIPYSGRHTKGSLERAFSYTHSRARRIIENSFGIMASVFRVVRKPMLFQSDSAKLITLACAYLHNFLRKRKSSRNIYSAITAFDSEDENGNLIQGKWRQEGSELLGLKWCSQKDENAGVYVREELSHYFHSQPLPWQHHYS